MNKKHLEKTKLYFDKWANHYDISPLRYLVFNPTHKRLFKEIKDKLVKTSRKIRILDIGCGTGVFILKLAKYVSNANIHGVDLSVVMLKKAIKKGIRNRITFQEGNVESLPYNNNMFDLVTCSHSFHHYQNKNIAIQEMYRVLKPGGILMIVDGCKDNVIGKVIFTIVEKIEQNVRHLYAGELVEALNFYGFENIIQKRFHFIPLLLTIATKGRI